MINQNFLWVIVGVLTVSIAAALHFKGVTPKFRPSAQSIAARPMDGEWDNTARPEVSPVPVPPQTSGPKSYKEAVALAGRENKPLLLFFTAKNCPPCVKMKSELAPSMRTVSGQIVWYEVEASVEPEVVKKYNITSTPTYIVVNGQEQVLKSGVGYKDVKSFGEWLGAPYNPPTVPPKQQIDPVNPPSPGPVPPSQRPQRTPPQPRG